MKQIKENRVVSLYHSSGITGVDNPLRDDTVFYKKNLDKLKALVK